ncbi:MAG: HD domain-containing protein [Bacteroidales bacterium]
MTHFVYPGATHSRFQHAIGAMHLMEMAIGVIRSKNHQISFREEEAVLAAILLHDIGHGPFSHALESSIIPDIPHEEMSLILMQELNRQFEGRLTLAIDIFMDRYHKRFLHQLVAGQLDMDRMDYLKRDSFFTGVTEGVIGSDRIIKMLNVTNDQLVVEAKGIYSVEKFLIARRLMYWQVYFHKTVVAAENLLIMLLRRARKLSLSGEKLFAAPGLQFFLENSVDISAKELFSGSPDAAEVIRNFVNLDDDDIMSAAKEWSRHNDKSLAILADWFTGRSLYRVTFQEDSFADGLIMKLKIEASKQYDIPLDEAGYFVFTGDISNYAYRSEDEKIRILYNNGNLVDISEASDMLNVSVLSKTVKKYFLCCPKSIGIKNIQ